MSNCTPGGAMVRIEPKGILPPGASLRAVVTTAFRDIVGQTNLLEQNDFAPAMTQAAPSVLADEVLEGFATSELEETEPVFPEPAAQWAGGSLTATGFLGTGGPGGNFDWLVPAGQLLVFDTTSMVVVGGPAFVPTTSATFLNGVVDVRNLRIEAGAVVRVQGPNPLTVLASGTVEVHGTLDVSGTPSPGVLTLNTTQIPEQGAPGQAGGGRGGTGSPLSTASSPKGGDGFGPFDVAAGGGQGGETGWNNVTAANVNGRRGAGGGGGRFGADQLATVGSGTFDQTAIGLDAEPGFDNLNPDANGALTGAVGPLGGERRTEPLRGRRSEQRLLRPGPGHHQRGADGRRARPAPRPAPAAARAETPPSSARAAPSR